MLQSSFPVSAQRLFSIWDNTTLTKFTRYASKYIVYTVYYMEVC